MKAKEFDERFDAGEDITTALDTARARRPGEEHRRVNVDFPAWMIAELDREATRLGVTRQSLIKIWIAEKLDNGDHRSLTERSAVSRLSRSRCAAESAD
ncbi:MAG TPA: CopG family transcriptional regulator [Mycobacterium sp.]|nr:CopG family transcriptional regulator [Mycobacterium sp.]